MIGRRSLVVGVLCGTLASALSAQQRVQFERTGYRITSLGARVSVTARVYDTRRRQVPNAPIAWRMSDSAVASVSPEGVVTSRRTGVAKVWAISGRDSASAYILVDQWAARFAFVPAIVRLASVGAAAPLRVEKRDATGHPIPTNTRDLACRAVDDRIAEFTSTGDVIAHANGTTFVRCADRGVSDSVRVEVRQRAVKATINQRAALAVKTVGDTFHVALTTEDARGTVIRDARPAWVSLTPAVLTVDALTGLARAMSPGDAIIVGDVGDASDTLSISGRPGAGGNVPVAVATTDTSSAARGPSLSITQLFLALGDTAQVPLTAHDATGSPIGTGDATLTSSDEAVLRVITQQRVVARGKGTATLTARLAGLEATQTINVRERGAITLASGTDATAGFNPPVFDTAAARVRNARELDSALAAIRRASAVRIYTGQGISLAGVFGQAVHSSTPTANIVERRSGLMYGGRLELAPMRLFKLSGALRTGVLSSTELTGEDLTVTEAEGALTFSPAEWFDIVGGYVMRGESTPLARQTWTFPRATAATRFTFVGGVVRTLTAVSVMPYAQYSDTRYQPSSINLGGEAGLELNVGMFNAGLTYNVERFSFEPVNSFRRTDQFSVLKLVLAFQYRR